MKRIIVLGTVLAIMLASLGGCSAGREGYQRAGWYYGDEKYEWSCTGQLPCKSGGGYRSGAVGE